MTDVRLLIDSALTALTSTVVDVPANGWDNPTPCTDWTVRDVLNHVTAEHLWVPHLLRGETIADVGDRYDGDVLGDDPVASWEAAATASADAFRDADLGAPVHVSFGDIPTEEYAEQMLIDLAVHRWDIQRGAGVGAGMDGAVVEHITPIATAMVEQFADAGIFAAPVETDSEYAHDQLLARLGRDPFWKAPAQPDA